MGKNRPIDVDVLDVRPGLWVWRLPHPDWREGLDWEQLVASTCVSAFGPYLFWRGNIPATELEGIEPGRSLPGGMTALYDGRRRNESPSGSPASGRWCSPTR